MAAILSGFHAGGVDHIVVYACVDQVVEQPQAFSSSFVADEYSAISWEAEVSFCGSDLPL